MASRCGCGNLKACMDSSCWKCRHKSNQIIGRDCHQLDGCKVPECLIKMHLKWHDWLAEHGEAAALEQHLTKCDLVVS